MIISINSIVNNISSSEIKVTILHILVGMTEEMYKIFTHLKTLLLNMFAYCVSDTISQRKHIITNYTI